MIPLTEDGLTYASLMVTLDPASRKSGQRVTGLPARHSA
jgi:hypothetical protein